MWFWKQTQTQQTRLSSGEVELSPVKTGRRRRGAPSLGQRTDSHPDLWKLIRDNHVSEVSWTWTQRCPMSQVVLSMMGAGVCPPSRPRGPLSGRSFLP